MARITPPSSSGASGADLLGIKDYTAGANASITSASLVDIDGSTFAVTFTAPSSGKVLVNITVAGTTSGDLNCSLGIRDSGGIVSGGAAKFAMNTQGLHDDLVTVKFYVTGLTPGNSYTWRAAASTNSGTFTIRSTSRTMEVWTAP